MLSPQSLSEPDRRLVAAWAADCAERVLPLFEREAPDDDRSRDAIARARAYARGELDSAGEIRRRFVAGRAAAYAVKAVGTDRPDEADAEIDWQIQQMTPAVRAALRQLPPVGEDAAGPFVAGGLLARGILGSTIHTLQTRIAAGV